MKNVKPVVVAVTAVSIIALLLGIGTVRVKADKPSPHKPVPATDTVLVKKVTLKGGRPAGVGGKKSTEAATGVLGTPLSSKGTRYAIVVGISDYPGTDSDLEYADDDADEMTLALTDVYGFRARNVTTLKDMAATRSAILAAIDAVQAQAGSGGAFGGHQPVKQRVPGLRIHPHAVVLDIDDHRVRFAGHAHDDAVRLVLLRVRLAGVDRIRHQVRDERMDVLGLAGNGRFLRRIGYQVNTELLRAGSEQRDHFPNYGGERYRQLPRRAVAGARQHVHDQR